MNSVINSPSRAFPLKPLAAAVLLVYAAGIQSAPVFQNAPGGNVTVTTPNNRSTVVTQRGSRAVANWRDFSIDAGETVQFVQDNANSVILNRVTGEDVSRILGTLQANGRVFVINPNGIVFGTNSQVNVNGLVASTLNLKQGSQGDDNEIGLELNGEAGNIINRGNISAKDILLIAPQIENTGTLQAEGAGERTVQLIAASEVIVNTAGDNLVLQVVAGHENAVIAQLGTVMAEGGKIALLASSISSGSGGVASVINVSNLNQATEISVQGDSVRLSGNINSGNGVANSASRLEVNAKTIDQTAAVNVGGVTQLNAESIVLAQAQNNFSGTVELNVAGPANLRSSGDLSVQGNVGSATLEGDRLALGEMTASGNLNINANNTITLSNLRANNLNITAGSVNQNQNSAVVVNGITTATAHDLNLVNSGNRFVGQVNLESTNEAKLRGAGRLEVAGRVNNAALEAQNLVLTNLTVTGDLNLKASTVNQTTGLAVQGETRIQSDGLVALELANDFMGRVNLVNSNSATVSLADTNDITVAGRARTVNITSLNAETGVVTLGPMQAQNLAVTADTINHSNATAMGGALQVTDSTQLHARNVELLNNANDFGGQVDLQASGQATLHDANRLSVKGQANNTTLQANSIHFEEAFGASGNLALRANSVQGTAPLNILGSSTFDNVQSLSLNNTGNDFVGVVELRNAGTVVLRDRNAIEVRGQVSGLNIGTPMNAGGVVTLGETTVGNLSVTAQLITQSEKLRVSGSTVLNANQVELNRFENDFVGTVTLGVSGQTALQDTNSLRVAGTVNTAMIEAGTLILGALTSQGDLTLAAGAIRQEGALIANARTFLSGGEVNLAREVNNAANNIFQGEVNLNLTGAANIRSSNNLILSGAASAVTGTATNNLSIAQLDSQQITLAAAQVQLQNLTAKGDLTVNGGTVTQQGNLAVEGQTNFGARRVELQQLGNDFKGNVILNGAGHVTLHDANNVRIQGSAESLQLTAANDIGQSGALAISGNSAVEATNIELDNNSNRLGGEVIVQASQTATVHTEADLRVSGNAANLTVASGGDLQFGNTNVGNLRATATGIIQQAASTAVAVTGPSLLNAQSVLLNNGGNDFRGILDFDVVNLASVRDANDLQIQGAAQNLMVNANNGILSVGGDEGLEIGGGTLSASTIELNKLNVRSAVRLQATSIVQTEASNTAGQLTLAAPLITLTQAQNDFRGELILEGVQTASINDMNQLTIGGTGGTNLASSATVNISVGETLTFTNLDIDHLNASAQNINQTASSGNITVKRSTRLLADTVDLSSNNDFIGVVDLKVGGRTRLHDANTLTLQGQAGQLEITARNIDQSDTMLVAGTTTLNVNNASLTALGNDFQGDVVLNVSGNAEVRDANSLRVAGRVNGVLQLQADSIEQATAQANSDANALRTESSLLLNASTVNLNNIDNQFKGAVQIENAAVASLTSQGVLTVAGSNLGSLDLTAQEVRLGVLGPLQQLDILANEVSQSAALLVLGATAVAGNRVELENENNDFVGRVSVQSNGNAGSTVAINDKNSLNIQGENLELTTAVQGDLNVQANNLVLGQTTVLGNSNINLTGALTQSKAVDLNNAVLRADRIVLNHSANRFSGTTQLSSEQQIELRTAGNFAANLIADTGRETGALALNIGGDTILGGEHVKFAQSRLSGNLTVNAKQISQNGNSNTIEVLGSTQLTAEGGAIDLNNSNNRFLGHLSANGGQTNVATLGDLTVLNLNSRGGEITAGGRLLLMGDVVQTEGALTFTAQGIPRPLSAAEIARLLPPTLDVFSSKEAVNPITALGRITLASPVILQAAGQIKTSAGALTRFNAPKNGSVVLTQNNQMKGDLSALAGAALGQSFVYQPTQGASLFAVNNEVKLVVGAQGVKADVVAIRARGLTTQGEGSVISARLPYNDLAVGTARSYAGLTLSIPLDVTENVQGTNFSFGESGATGLADANGGNTVNQTNGAIRVEVGDTRRAGLGGFLTVLPFEGSNLLPGQVVYLEGPVGSGTQAFFYDGARSLNRVPVVYNGSLLLSPQENAALTTAQGAVALARQEQTRSVVQTENVTGKIINGVVVEVGPGRPATEGVGGAGKPESCEAAEFGLNCKLEQ